MICTYCPKQWTVEKGISKEDAVEVKYADVVSVRENAIVLWLCDLLVRVQRIRAHWR